MHPRMYVGGMGERSGEVGWQKWTVASSTSRAAMSLGEQGRRREEEGEEEGLDFCTRQIEI